MSIKANADGFFLTDVGLVPTDWNQVQLGELVDDGSLMVQTGFSCSKRNQNGYGLPHIRPMNVSDDGQITLEDLNYVDPGRDISRYLLKPGDIVFNNTNSEKLVGKTAYWTLDGDFAISNHMTIMRVVKSRVVNSVYLAIRLHKMWQDGYSKTICRRYVNQAGIGLERMKNIPIPLPPVAEQRRIAAVLTTIQDAMAAQEDVIAAARAFKRSLMHRLFTYGPGRVPAETKETEIGEIPSHWEVRSIGSFAKVSSGTTPSRKRVDYWLNGSIPWVKTGEVDYCVINGTEEFITPIALQDTSLTIYSPGTLLLAMYGQGITRGKVALLGIAATINQACAALTLQSEAVSGNYLYHCLSASYERLRSHSHGTQQLNLNGRLVQAFQVPVPIPDEQTTISTMVDSIDTKIAAEEDRKAALEALFKSMLHQLMTGQIRLLSDEAIGMDDLSLLSNQEASTRH